MKSEVNHYCRELFSLTQEKFEALGKESNSEIVTSGGKLVKAESHSLEFRLRDRIIAETSEFIQQNPASLESLKTNKDALASELAKQFASLPQKRLGGDEIYTKKVRVFDIPLFGQAYQAAYAKNYKMQNIATPAYGNNKDEIKDIIEYSLRKHSDFESPTVIREVENTMHQHPGKFSADIAKQKAEGAERNI